MKNILFIVFLQLLAADLVAQLSSGDPFLILVKGRVLDAETRSLLTDASIAVKDEQHKTLSFIPRIDEEFSLKLISGRDYQLLIHLQHYRDTVFHVPQNAPLFIDLGAILLRKKATELPQVVVKPPLSVQLPGKTLYRVSEDPDAASSMSLDLFRKIPGITIDGRDQIRLNGQTQFRILINGRPSNLFTRRPSEVLRQFPASLIKEVEVLSPPPARYEAEGLGGIINIVLARSNVKGTTGSVGVSFYSPLQLGQQLSLTGRHGQWGVFGTLSNSLGQNPVTPRASSMEDLINKVTIDQTGFGGSDSRSRMGNLEISFEANAHNVFTLSADMSQGGNDSRYQQQVNLSDLSFAAEYSEYRSRASSQWGGMDFSFDYQRSSPVKSNRTFTFSLRQSQSADQDEDQYDEYKLDQSDRFTSLSNSDNNYLERTAQVDYFTPFKKHSFEVGSKFIRRQNFSLAYYGFTKDYRKVDDRQDIFSGYSSFTFKFGSWKFRVGMRAEASRVDVLFRSDSTSVNRRYGNLLPNLEVSKTIRTYSTVFVNYSQRIQRPGIHYLNPFLQFSDPYNVSYGNPQLLPALFHSVHLGFSRSFRQSSFSTNLNYQFSNNSIVDMYEWRQDTIKGATYGNLGFYRYAAWSINSYLRISEVVSLSLGGYLNYYQYSQNRQQPVSVYEGLSETLSSGLSFRFPRGWSFSANYNYNGNLIQFQSRNKGYSFHGLHLNKNFSKPKLALSAALQNPFMKDRRNEYLMETSSFVQRSYYTVIMRRLTVSLTWRFGKFHAAINKPARGISNEDLMK